MLPFLAVVLCCAVALKIAEGVWQREGELNQRIHAREQVIAALAKQHRVDTVSFHHWKTHYDTTSDTLRFHDTVWVPKTLADSTVRTCSTALTTCELLNLQKDSLIRDLKKRHPSRFGCNLGVAVTPKGIGPGGSCGIRF